MKIAIIANSKIKNFRKLYEQQIIESAKKNHLTFEFHSCAPNKLEKTIQKLHNKNFQTFLIAGGDGTVRSAAQALADFDIPMAIFPAGTFNHFAQELNYPKDIPTIMQVIKNYKVKQVDIAEVNQKIFINNSSIGFYSHVLKLKEKYQNILAQNKILKIIFTAVNLFKTIPIYQLKMEIDGKTNTFNTPLVFIGNNYYHTSLPNIGDRQTLTAGLLSVYILKCKNRWEIFQCILNMAFNAKNKKKYLTQNITNSLSIFAKSKSINVILDGELFKLSSPLHYKTHPKKLSIIVP